jgi:hypothetical protein
VTAVLDIVNQSPAAVAAHDKQAWLDLFARHHVVEDPVGGAPVVGGLYDRRSGGRGPGGLARFWDTYIAPRSVRFEYEARDIVKGLDVVRDVTLHISDDVGVEISTPAHLLYQLTEDEGGLRIRRLAAHWEVTPTLVQTLGIDSTKLRSLSATSVRMLKHQGIKGATAFGGAMRSVGAAGKAAALDLAAASRRGDETALRLLGGAVVTNPTKLIAAGDVVSMSCSVGGAHAVVLFYLDRRSKRVVEADVYVA